MTVPTLPSDGQTPWGDELNAGILEVNTTANNAETNVVNHSNNIPSDPHGDRAYAQSLVTPITGGVNSPNGFVVLNSSGTIPSNLEANNTDWINVTRPPYNVPTNNSDGTAGLISAISTGKILYFPAGNYSFNASSITITSGMTWVGAGYPNSFITFTSALSMDTGTQVNDMEICGLTIQATGNDIFQNANIARLRLHDCSLIQNSAGFCIWNTTSSLNDMIECRFWNNKETVFGATRTKPAWYLFSNTGRQVNQCIWKDNVTFNTNNDASQYWFDFRSANSGGQTFANNTFRNIAFEHPYGGMISLASCNGTIMEQLVCWDVPATPDISNNLIFIYKNSVNPNGSTQNIIRGFTRRGGTLLTSPSPVADIYLDLHCNQTTIDTCGQTAGGTVFTINDNGTGTDIRNMTSNTNFINSLTQWQPLQNLQWSNSGFGPNAQFRVRGDTLEIIGDMLMSSLASGGGLVFATAPITSISPQIIPIQFPTITNMATNARIYWDGTGNLFEIGIPTGNVNARATFHALISLTS